jgi:hypothetical protein
MVQGFGLILHDHTDEEITEAFKTWMKTQSVLPTPANIFDLCEEARASKSRATEDYSAAREATRKRLQAERDAIKPMTDEEIQTYLAAQRGNKHSKTIDKTGDTKHFDSLPADAKQAIIADIPQALARLRQSQGLV